MNILFITGREIEYPRNHVMLQAMQSIGSVTQLPQLKIKSLLIRNLCLCLIALPYLVRRWDLIFVGFYGHLLMLPVGILNRAPVLFDAYLSTYDTLCFDRKRFGPRSIMGRLSFWLDRLSCSLADLVLLDTQAHLEYFQKELGVAKNKLRFVYVGADEHVFYPRKVKSTTPTILYYGSYLPLHGADVIVRAACWLQNKAKLTIKMIGSGQDYQRVELLARELQVENIEFLPPVPYHSLPEFIASSDICLGGHFGSSRKAGRVISNKTFQCMAMGKPVIVGNNQANHELLNHGYDAYFCEMNDPIALGKSILELITDKELRTRLGKNAYTTFMKRGSVSIQVSRIQNLVKTIT